jgi:hypothetical protein
MAVLTRRRIKDHNVVASFLSTFCVEIVCGATVRGLLDKMEEVLVREFETITLWAWRGVRFVPNEVVTEYPTETLHRDRKT